MNKITVIGLGASDLEQLSLGTYRLLKEADHLYIRTEEHPVVAELRLEGVEMESFDSIYEANDSFEAVYQQIVDKLLEMSAHQPITYAVPGHPLVAERTVQLLIEKERTGEIELHIAGGSSFLDPIFTALRIDPIEGFQLLDGTDLKRDDVRMDQHVLIGQVYDAFIASDVKLSLMEKYPDHHVVTIVTSAGSQDEKLTEVPLFELDRTVTLNNLTTVYVPPILDNEQRLKEWSSFREIIAILRGPDGCPWDREQTHESLKRYLIEESFELIQAIDEEDDDAIIEELGDVLLQVFLHAQIGEDNGYFAMEDVLETVAAKMIRRHPHVFAQAKADTTGEVLKNWQAIKDQEKPQTSTLLEGQERLASSLLTSYNYQKTAAKVGFDWPSIEGAFDKFQEEWQEFQEEVHNGGVEQQLDELGDVLFTIVNIARFLKISPEEAMWHTNKKFKSRFQFVEQSVKQGSGSFEDYTLEELEEFWQQAKRKEESK
ncbi:nucleoside triphosphate pyrophosphohydrolase [Sporosarcina sp. P26b]|uniref:nucleoside triphosphate pyrophosphohydrolase n=1 Tax=unclassified Sporosarcina TaxID=2647733 RepID=UPI000C16E973|nr:MULTISPECIES: nucleoside triphosphate pyrophosphohydrolase [unclassified Sporosarcina]PIC72693.1 nucleoside triphosphate pyrophosphohydrolase [Sporosarcina sp. P17b]PIC95535.1 nucleoside triphosphate pyrophosphohydrolase [Sporosarcina sp. P26b]